MRELWLQMWHDIHPDAKSKFVTKGEILKLSLTHTEWTFTNVQLSQQSVDLWGMKTAIGIMAKLAVHGQIIANIGFSTFHLYK